MTTQDTRVADAALRRVTRDRDAYAEAKAAAETARQRLQEAVRLAHQAGARQVDILRAMDHEWSREYVRLLTREETP